MVLKHSLLVHLDDEFCLFLLLLELRFHVFQCICFLEAELLQLCSQLLLLLLLQSFDFGLTFFAHTFYGRRIDVFVLVTFGLQLLQLGLDTVKVRFCFFIGCR